MIKVPFKPETFSREMKPRISGMNLSLEYYNIESSLYKVARKIHEIISVEVYEYLVGKYANNDTEEVNLIAIDYLQRSMLHLTIYEHMPYIVLNISNDGVTTKKSDTETTAYKYQSDELNNDLISTGWFWMNSLVQHLSTHEEEFPLWKESSQKKELDTIPVTFSDFKKWVGIDLSAGEYFMISVSWIIREVWMDCVCSRFKNPEKTPSIARALCYEVMGRACQRLAYSCLPAPIRKDFDNEMAKSTREKSDKDIRERISSKFLSQASTYWNTVDMEIKKEEIMEKKKTQSSQPVIGERTVSENDKFCFS